MALVNVLFEFYIVERKFKSLQQSILLYCLWIFMNCLLTPMRQSLAVKQEQTPAEQEKRVSRDSFVSHIFSKADCRWCASKGNERLTALCQLLKF